MSAVLTQIQLGEVDESYELVSADAVDGAFEMVSIDESSESIDAEDLVRRIVGRLCDDVPTFSGSIIAQGSTINNVIGNQTISTNNSGNPLPTTAHSPYQLTPCFSHS